MVSVIAQCLSTILQTSILYESITTPPIRIALLLRLPPPSVALTPEVRCAVVGNVDSGKSTTLGVLTRGALDDGRGRARVSLFRHKHEIESGRTSSVGMEVGRFPRIYLYISQRWQILGFGPSGAPILPSTSHSTELDVIRREKMSWEDISIQASKIISFIGMDPDLTYNLYASLILHPIFPLLQIWPAMSGTSKPHYTG